MFKFLTRAALALAIGASLMPLAAAPGHAEGLKLIIGRITDKPEKYQEKMAAMGEYIASHLTQFGVDGVEVVMVPSALQMEKLLREGKVDILSETPFMALQLEEDGVVDILMREWKSGVPEYHTVIFARKDSGIANLGDLAGQKVAFEDSGSTSGYLLPRNAIERAGLQMKLLARITDRAPYGRVGYTFAGSEEAVVSSVVEGKAVAGALSNLDWDDKDTVPPQAKANLKIIFETRPVTRSTLMVRSALPAEVKAALARVLETMHESDEGKKVMKGYNKVARYDRFEAGATQGLEESRNIWLRMRGRAIN